MPFINDEDFDLVQQCQAGIEKAFEQIVIKYQQKIFNQCYFLLNQNRDDAEDAAQEVFLNVYKKISEFRGESKFSTWLYQVTRNHCLNLINRRNRNEFLAINSTFYAVTQCLPRIRRSDFLMSFFENFVNNTIVFVIRIHNSPYLLNKSLQSCLEPFSRHI